MPSSQFNLLACQLRQSQDAVQLMEISLGLQIFGTVPFFKSLISAFNFY